MTPGSKLVAFLSADSPLVSDSFGAFSLMNQVEHGQEFRVQVFESPGDVAEHRDPSHTLDPGGDSVGQVARIDGLGNKMNGLLARTAHAVERGSWNLDRHSGQ